MSKETIDICGITPQCDLPKECYKYTCRELCNTYNLCIPSNKPDMENLLQVFIDALTLQTKKICTHNEMKLFIDAVLCVKILYVADTSCQSVHSESFKIPFCSFIPIPKNMNNVTAEIYIEEAFIRQLNSRSFYISTLMIICPSLPQQSDEENECWTNEFYNPRTKKKTLAKANLQLNTKDFYEDEEYEYEDKENVKNNAKNTEDIEVNIDYDMNSNLDYKFDINSNSNNEYFQSEWE